VRRGTVGRRQRAAPARWRNPRKTREPGGVAGVARSPGNRTAVTDPSQIRPAGAGRVPRMSIKPMFPRAAALVAVAAVCALVAPTALARKGLQPPTNLTATGGNAQVTLSWNASSGSGLAGYDVYRQNSGTFVSIATVGKTTTYTDTGLTNGTTYTYEVKAISTSGSQTAPSNTASATPNVPPPGPCTGATAPSTYAHVVWILMENHSYNEIIGSSAAPYINQVAGECGLATNYFAASHPSLPNYIALTSGSTQGITDDNNPSSHHLTVPSIFSQVGSGNWRSLEESMPSNCAQTDSGEYAVRHNPAAYYTNITSDCLNFDVPYTAFNAPDLSAQFTFVTPNLISDMHDGTVQQGDTWLSSFLPLVLSSAQYQAGNTAVFITWDEDDGTQNNQVPTLVIAPSVHPGTTSATMFTHYSLLRTTEEMLGFTTFLGNASTATSMRSAFGL
jgi:hypothetical protein